jgi:hypothetical protein
LSYKGRLSTRVVDMNGCLELVGVIPRPNVRFWVIVIEEQGSASAHLAPFT